MPYTDLPLDQLRTYRPEADDPVDLDRRWRASLDGAREHDIAVVVRPAPTPLRAIEVHDVTFAGFAGQPVRAWLRRPANVRGPLPVVVEYLGYGMGRGLPHENLLWAATGYAHLVMDTRGQGSAGDSGGHTPDVTDVVGAGDPAHPGFMTRGVRQFESFYYRRLITDAVRAVDAVRALDGVNGDQVVVSGVSQGGGLALAVAGLVTGLAGVLTDVPFLCRIPSRGADQQRRSVW